MSDFALNINNDNCNDFFYYTPVKNKINFKIFSDYSNQIKNQNISEELADLMGQIENLIVSSDAFKLQDNKPIVNQQKWQVYKVKKNHLTSLFMILNKITSDNLNTMIEESLQYKTFSKDEINQLADVFLGKCLMETKNINIFINYFKLIMDYQLWYVNTGDKIISFRDTMLDRLENEYDRLTRMAGLIEDVFKNRIKDSSSNDLDGSEDYLKKKNIILSLINLIGLFFNNKIISFTLLDTIFNKLKQQYDNCSSKKIYLELWLILWNTVLDNLHCYFKEYYDLNVEWLNLQKNNLIEIATNNCDINKNSIADISRLVSLIDSSLTKNYKSEPINTNKVVEPLQEDISFYNLQDKILYFNTKFDYIEFKKCNNDTVIKNYITKHILSAISNDHTQLSKSMPNIKLYLVAENELSTLIDNLLDDDDITCDYPNFKKYIKLYI